MRSADPTTIVDCSGVGPGGISRMLTEVVGHWPAGQRLELVAPPAGWQPPASRAEITVTAPRSGGRGRTIAAATLALRRATGHTGGGTRVLSLSPSLAVAGSRLPVTTVLHDFAYRLWPADLSSAVIRYRKASYATAIRRSARLLCVSARTRHDLAGLYGVADERCRVWRPGSDPAGTAGALPAPLAGVGRFVVVPGHAPHKGVELAIEALPAHPDLVLAVLTGGQPVARYREAALRSVAADRILLLDRLTDAEYLATLRAAAALLMPSHFEGYGLPAAEALRLGTPTVISPDPALHEATGGAAIRMDDWSAEALSRALHRIAEPLPGPLPPSRSWRAATAELAALVHDAAPTAPAPTVPAATGAAARGAAGRG